MGDNSSAPLIPIPSDDLCVPDEDFDDQTLGDNTDDGGAIGGDSNSCMNDDFDDQTLGDNSDDDWGGDGEDIDAVGGETSEGVADCSSSFVDDGKFQSRQHQARYVGTFSHLPLPYIDYGNGFQGCDDFNVYYNQYGWRYRRQGCCQDKQANSDTPKGWQLVVDTMYFESALLNSWVMYNAFMVEVNGKSTVEGFGVYCSHLVDEILVDIVSCHYASRSSSASSSKKRKLQ